VQVRFCAAGLSVDAWPQGFSGRELAKLIASVQAAVYGSHEAVLTPEMFLGVVDVKASASICFT
jgi:hypothetical protein